MIPNLQINQVIENVILLTKKQTHPYMVMIKFEDEEYTKFGTQEVCNKRLQYHLQRERLKTLIL